MKPVVSVVIPSHRPHYRVLAEASVDAQTFQEIELVVRASPLWWASKPNEAMRAGVGEYLLFLGDDDVLLPGFVEKAVHRARQGYDVVSTDCETFGEGWSQPARFGPVTLEAFRAGNPIWITSLVRRDLFDAVGGFDETLIWYDYGFWYECFKSDAAFGHVNEVLWRHREGHPGKGTLSVDAVEARRQIHSKYPELSRVA